MSPSATFPLLAGLVGAAAASLIGAAGQAGVAHRPRIDQAASGPLAVAPDGRRLVLTFSDDFDSFRPWTGREGVWRTTYGDGQDKGVRKRTLPANAERQVYVDEELLDDEGRGGFSPFSVRAGLLEIQATPLPRRFSRVAGDLRYSSGLINTQPSFSQLYGYFEMRALLPVGKGLWPAFWMLPADLSWPPEIDVMESIGDAGKVYVTAHSNAAKGHGGEASVTPGVFHTFAVSWDERQLVWYVDGVAVERQTTPADMHKPMFLLANLAVGGNWPGDPDATTRFPAVYAIDYIRAYRFAP